MSVSKQTMVALNWELRLTTDHVDVLMPFELRALVLTMVIDPEYQSESGCY